MSALAPYRVRAHNAATASENKIHDDTVARQYGFKGGLVPGVTVYAYMTQPVMREWGRPWLERGTMSARFIKPVYEGEFVTVTLTTSEGDVPRFDVVACNEAGETCAVGQASLPAARLPLPDVSRFARAPLPNPRPPVSEEALRALTQPGSIEQTFDRDHGDAATYFADVREEFAGLDAPGAPASSGYLIRYANYALAENVRLNPWIHVSSEVTHFDTLASGEAFSVRSRITDLFERKGHRFVRMDVLIVAGDERPIMFVDHTAIYDIRRAG